MITGVWFSREAAEEYLKNHRYNFGESARAYCHSGCYSGDWMELTNELKKQEAAPDLLEACINSFKTFHSIGCTMEAEIMQELEAAIKKATE